MTERDKGDQSPEKMETRAPEHQEEGGGKEPGREDDLASTPQATDELEGASKASSSGGEDGESAPTQEGTPEPIDESSDDSHGDSPDDSTSSGDETPQPEKRHAETQDEEEESVLGSEATIVENEPPGAEGESLTDVLEELSEPSEVVEQALKGGTSAEAVAEAIAKVARQKVTDLTTELINTRNRLSLVEKSLAGASEEKEKVEEERAQLLEEKEQVEEEKEQLNNRLLRAVADLENYRRRSEREKEELKRYGIKDVVLELIPAVDNMERALEHAREKADGESKSLFEGVEMVYRQILTALKKHGVQGFDSVGEQFDPERHDAIQQVETSEHATGTIVEEFQKGYFLHDRLVRAALVSVAKYVPTDEDEEVQPQQEEEESAPEDVSDVEVSQEAEKSATDGHLGEDDSIGQDEARVGGESEESEGSDEFSDDGGQFESDHPGMDDDSEGDDDGDPQPS